MSDLISRQAAIDAVIKETYMDGAYGYSDAKSLVDAICDLPSAQPEITDEQARLADDSGSYDSLIPCEDTTVCATDRQVAGKLEPCEDCISRDAAIKTLQKDLLWTGYTVKAVKEDSIDLIKKLPPVTPKLPECEDVVSRTDMLTELDGWIEDLYGSGHKESYSDMKLIRKSMMELPPVTLKPKTGHWIEHSPSEDGKARLIECSECGAAYVVDYLCEYRCFVEERKYCNKCGAKMEGEAHVR